MMRLQGERALEAKLNHRGTYIVEWDASDLAASLAERKLPSHPDLTRLSVHNGFTFAPAASDVLSLGAQVHVKRRAGVAAITATYRRTLTAVDSLEAHATIGYRSYGTAMISRQLTPDTAAHVTVSYASDAGVGLVASSSHNFGEGLSGDFSWAVGPAPAVSLGASKTFGERCVVQGRLELGGASSGASASATWKVGPRAALKAQIKASVGGISAEVGGTARISELNSAGVFVGVAAPGVTVRLLFSRAGHKFSFPVLVHPTKDVKVFAAAVTLPPLLVAAANLFLVKPLQKSIRARQLQKLQREQSVLVGQAQSAARAQATLLEPAALKRLRKELAEFPGSGLVVVEATYGYLDERDVSERLGRPRSLGTFFRSRVPAGFGPEPEEDDDGMHPAEAEEDGEEGEAEGARRAAAGAGVPPAGETLPPMTVDVTTAVRFQVEDGTLILHAGSKAALVGFADPCAGTGLEKKLRVVCTLRGVPCEAVVGDEEALEMSLESHAIADPVRAEGVRRRAEALAETFGPGSNANDGNRPPRSL